MYNVVISFHSSMSAKYWKDRSKTLQSLFPNPGTETLFIDGGSIFSCKDLKSDAKTTSPDCPRGVHTSYGDLISRWPKWVDRSPSDPKYKADDLSTHKRKSILQGYVEHFHPQLANQQYRVAVLGYSTGCGGVGAFLNTTDVGYIDTAVAIDGIHWGKPDRCPDGSECMRLSARPWMNFAALAAFGKAPDNPTIPFGSHCMVITNSDTFPPTCCRKSREASEFIAETILGNVPKQPMPDGLWNVQHNPPVKYPAWNNAAGRGPALDYSKAQEREYWRWAPSYPASNGLWIMSYNNIDRGGSGHWDHVYQGEVVLPLVIEKIVVPRWKASTGGTIVGV